ncbi:CAP domain-containing protein [Microdochium trichocladiopsis]|uniref:CAP domain-containing protein n=1 Tax=Microdochium trichocladiopsis TaxID=1682393 RepID=A0A9P8XZD0_9PEZI|nr:CAP domain-containing protein [Microdochium trichocladiopsis]KAH7021338.1 CAP domain-containing protein [Microdochium trichocladiopsis]
MRFSATAALLLGTLSLANPIPEPLDIGPDDVLDPNTIPVDIGATIITGPPALLNLGTGGVSAGGKREPIPAPISEEAEHELVARDRSKDQQRGLKLHNQARRVKGIPKLTWDKQLAADALAWAQHLAQTGKFEHSSNESRPGQGENLAYSYSSTPITRPIASGTKLWLAEESNYHGEAIPEGNFAAYGHYTQCLWKASTKIGIAAVQDSKGAWYTVARYGPAGNVIGQKPY